MDLTFESVIDCPKCNNTGFVTIKENGEIVFVNCDCRQKRKTLLSIKKSGLEDNLKNFRFENFKTGEEFQKQMFDLCQHFIKQSEKRFLYIGGQSGCGKTHLGTAVCGHYIDSGMIAYYQPFQTIMNEMKSNVNDQEYNDVLFKYGDVAVLYIDDFMKFPPTKPDINHSFQLINRRAVQNKITIFTSERALDEIVGIDEALGGRIKQLCGDYSLSIAKRQGRNWRLNP